MALIGLFVLIPRAQLAGAGECGAQVCAACMSGAAKVAQWLYVHANQQITKSRTAACDAVVRRLCPGLWRFIEIKERGQRRKDEGL